MKITDAFLGEHGVFYAQFTHMEQALPATAPLTRIQDHAAMLTVALASHAHMEDELLFAPLEPHLGTRGGPLAMMRMEHSEIEGSLLRIPTLQDASEARGVLLHAVEVARGHFAKEEQILYPMAQQALGDGHLSQLGAKWAEKRRVSLPG